MSGADLGAAGESDEPPPVAPEVIRTYPDDLQMPPRGVLACPPNSLPEYSELPPPKGDPLQRIKKCVKLMLLGVDQTPPMWLNGETLFPRVEPFPVNGNPLHFPIFQSAEQALDLVMTIGDVPDAVLIYTDFSLERTEERPLNILDFCSLLRRESESLGRPAPLIIAYSDTGEFGDVKTAEAVLDRRHPFVHGAWRRDDFSADEFSRAVARFHHTPRGIEAMIRMLLNNGHQPR